MPSRAILVALVVLFFGCSQQDIKQEQKQKPVYKKSKYSRLLAKYKDVSFDTLKVSSPEKEGWNSPRVEIDSLDFRLFPKSLGQYNFEGEQVISELFAMYKFPIDDDRIGLMTLTPSEYAPTSVKLFFYNRKLDSITAFIELAESVGDGGDYMTKDSWLFKNHNGRLSALSWVMSGTDNSVLDSTDNTVDEHDYYYLIDLSKLKPDTISEDQSYLMKRFAGILSTKD